MRLLVEGAVTDLGDREQQSQAALFSVPSPALGLIVPEVLGGVHYLLCLCLGKLEDDRCVHCRQCKRTAH